MQLIHARLGGRQGGEGDVTNYSNQPRQKSWQMHFNSYRKTRGAFRLRMVLKIQADFKDNENTLYGIIMMAIGHYTFVQIHRMDDIKSEA